MKLKRKWRFFLASDLQKEEEWLTEMSQNGLHCVKFRFGAYLFEEDPERTYMYQIDFQGKPDEEYYQLYEDAGWEPVDDWLQQFHYFRRDASLPGSQKLYSDASSVKDSYTRMLRYYIMLLLALIILPLLLVLLTWKGYKLQLFVLGLDLLVVVLYLYLFIGLKRKIRCFSQRKL